MFSTVTLEDLPVSQQFGVNPGWYARFGLPGHNGLDMACPVGTQLYAPAGCEVVEVNFDKLGYGLYIKLRTEQADWLFAHLSDAGSTAVADTLVLGTPFGWTGNTGFSSGPHLHIGYRPLNNYRNTPYKGMVDPEPFLALLAQAP